MVDDWPVIFSVWWLTGRGAPLSWISRVPCILCSPLATCHEKTVLFFFLLAKTCCQIYNATLHMMFNLLISTTFLPNWIKRLVVNLVGDENKVMVHKLKYLGEHDSLCGLRVYKDHSWGWELNLKNDLPLPIN